MVSKRQRAALHTNLTHVEMLSQQYAVIIAFPWVEAVHNTAHTKCQDTATTLSYHWLTIAEGLPILQGNILQDQL